MTSLRRKQPLEAARGPSVTSRDPDLRPDRGSPGPPATRLVSVHLIRYPPMEAGVKDQAPERVARPDPENLPSLAARQRSSSVSWTASSPS